MLLEFSIRRRCFCNFEMQAGTLTGKGSIGRLNIGNPRPPWAALAGFAVPGHLQSRAKASRRKKGRKGGREGKERRRGVWILATTWRRYGGENGVTRPELNCLRSPPGLPCFLSLILGCRDPVSVILHPIPLDRIILLATWLFKLPQTEVLWAQGDPREAQPSHWEGPRPW